MESITIKVEDKLAKEIEKARELEYSTKTEFIREAIRDKLKEIRREALIREFIKFKGKAKIKTSDAERQKIGEEVFNEFVKEKGLG